MTDHERPADPGPDDERTADARLAAEQNIWLATTRPDGRPHLVAIWFGYVDGRFYVCTWGSSVKVNNVAHNPRAVVSLESGAKPDLDHVIAEALGDG